MTAEVASAAVRQPHGASAKTLIPAGRRAGELAGKSRRSRTIRTQAADPRQESAFRALVQGYDCMTGREQRGRTRQVDPAKEAGGNPPVTALGLSGHAIRSFSN
jgi:hypothetical protein